MSVTPSQFQLIGKLLDASAVRQRVIGQNIANVNTPGYRAQQVSFEETLAEQLREGESTSTVSRSPRVTTRLGNPVRADGNNVDVDQELGESQKNELLHMTYTQVLASKLNVMRMAITGR